MITDPISDMLSRIRNALGATKREVEVPYSRMKMGIAKILEREGYIKKVEETREGKFPLIKIQLAYDEIGPCISKIQRVSSPGCRVYAKSNELPRPLSDRGCAIISTPNGLMTHKEARVRKLGGEIICEIY